MDTKKFTVIIPMIVGFFSKGWGDDLDISFRRAVMNDVQNHRWRLIVIPAALACMIAMSISAIIFLIFGAATWFMSDMRAAEVALVTGGGLLTLALIALVILVNNIRFVLNRVENVQDAVIQAQESRPFQQLYHQIKEEQRLFLEAVQKNKQKRSIYEPDNISVV